MSSPALRQQLRSATGLALSLADVGKAMKQRMHACDTETEEEYAALALRQQEELDALVELLVVPETWFFRDGDAFQALVRIARERLERRLGPVRILSMPCASGEEAYSIAMALHDGGIAASDLNIEGIDISGKAIEQALRADYRSNSFRVQDLAFRNRHFDAHANAYSLHPGIRRMVAFRQGNLFDAKTVAGPYDILFCRNLLIYFDEASQQAAIGRLKALLADDGVLFVGYAEAGTLIRKGFELAPFPKAFALRKRRRLAATGMPLPLQPVLRKHAAALATPAGEQSAPAPAARQPVQPSPLEQARQLADRGLVDASAAAYRDFLASHPDNVEACFMLGLLSERRHEPQAAETYLRRAIYLDPNHYEALCHLALLAEGRGNSATANTLRQRAARVYRRIGSATHRSDE